ncbi:guanine nucleotide exchange factor DBS-like isoform X2 [Homalodisca vitripennis]|uniref:guanine nucleotide exchange factor DBS-like isoform X2 n=1 Tax=Homalodisca vitripennis TaxID=197043 RepID=UPI001EE9C058|nr:guanine nucleotide exchange factor DBS-like isoform X2 [Homalodisca vitripennis]
MEPSSEENEVSVSDVADLLHQQYAIITGGKSQEGFPLISLPDQGNFANLSDADYQKLVLYLTSVPSMQEADMGFVLVVDRRNDKWSSVKTTLLKISSFFPGVLNVAYVVRPSGFFQKAISEVSNKLFKEEFKFKVVVCSCVEDLHQYVDKTELTTDLDGTMPYSHSHWIQQRIALEQFSCQTRAVSLSLDDFTRRLRESAVELGGGGTLEVAQALLVAQGGEYTRLKEEILLAAKRGESLLGDIRQRLSQTPTKEPSSLANITAVERLLVQLEETERTFDEFWQQHSARLHQYLELKTFEQDFKAIQCALDRHLKTVSELTEVGETVDRVDTLIRDLVAFQKLCVSEVERAEELVSSGERMLRGRHYLHLDCVAPKCEELQRMSVTLADRLQRRSEFLAKCRELQESIDKANKWCTQGIDLLASQHIEKCSCSAESAEAALAELEAFMASASQFKVSSPRQFHVLFQDSITPETKALVTQVLQRIDDVTTMCDKRLSSLRRLAQKPPRPVQTVTPEPQAPAPLKKVPLPAPALSEGGVVDTMRSKRNHVLTELLDTERIYVSELGSILTGYKYTMSQEDMKPLLPAGLEGKADILFGNLEELYRFHGEVFLQDLENCISTTELVALCFTHRRESFYRLYSYYCQNNPRSERLRASLGDNTFFVTCQRKLGHKLPLAAYLLKPVQRITKYQLLLKDLLHYSEGQKWCGELQEALDCMLVVLKCVNDSMHQIAITGYWGELSELGELLMQGSFSVSPESKKDRLRDLRLKPMQRHIFLYQKALLFCKKSAAHNKATYHFKRILKMSQVGLTETVKGDGKSFEVWLQGRQEVYIIQAATTQQKSLWVEQIKKLLLDQLTELKIKQFNKSQHMPLRLTSSLDSSQVVMPRTLSAEDSMPHSPALSQPADDDVAWSSDYTNSEEDEPVTEHGGRFTALADYCAVGHSEVNMREGDTVELLKEGCAGWWYIKHVGGGGEEGWVPAAYLEHCSRKTSRSSQSVSSQVSVSTE